MMIIQPDSPFGMIQSLLFSSVILSFLYVFSAHIALKVLKVRDPKFISSLYLMPMFVPLVMYAISFRPLFFFELRAFHLFPQFKSGIIFGDFFIRDVILRNIGSQYFFIADTFSLAGLSFGIALFVFWYVFGSRVVCRLQGVVEITNQEPSPKGRDFDATLGHK
jgi:hypothetical protein